ncbi:WD_REPEATS_REGION domain-containing protein, partial [Mortierella sp. AD032]
MSAPPPGDFPTQATSPVVSFFVSTNGHLNMHSSTTNVNCQVPKDENENCKGSSNDPGASLALLRKAQELIKLKSKKGVSAMPSRPSMNSVKPTITPVATDGDGSPISPLIQKPEYEQSTNDHHALARENLHPTRANGKPPPPSPIAMHFREGIFFADSPIPTHRTSTPADHHARFESTLQLAFCVSLLLKDHLISTSESGSAEIPVLDESERAWLSAMREDLPAQEHIYGLVSKLVAEFVKVEFMEIATVSEVVILGPVLCQEDYRTLLLCLIQRFNQTPLLNVDMLQGMIQLVQSASPGYLEDDYLVRILASLRMRLESTHAPSKAHLYQLVFAVSKVLEVMVISEVKDLNRQRDHESLLAVLHGLRDMKDDGFLKFQIDYAHQTLLYLTNGEISWQAFLRHADSIAVGVSAAACVFKLDPMNALAAVENLQQVAGNAIDIIKLKMDAAPALHATAESAAQAGGSVYWSEKKEAWFWTLQTAYVFVRQGRLVEFNKLVCDAGCRFDINFQYGVCQLLGEIAANQLWNIASRRSAIDFLGELYKVGAGQIKGIKIQKCVESILSRVSRMSWPDVSEHASSILANLQDEIADTETDHPLHACLPQPRSFPLLDRVVNIPEVEYDLDRMRFQRLRQHLLPVFIPLRAKATLKTSDTDFFPLMQRVQEFLDSDRQVFLLLGDSGSGKSLFCRQLERVLWGQYEVGCRIPLFINLPSIDRPDNDLIGKHLRDHNNILAERVQDLKQHRQLVLICDGYDESRLTTNLHTTNGLNQSNVKMVISCRNTFLSSSYEGRFRPRGSDNYHDSSSHLFEEATIVPFSESDIREFVKQYVMDPAVAAFLGYVPVPSQEEYLKKLRVIPNVMKLAKNPFLLTLALKALPFLSIDDLNQTQIEATKQALYRGFTEEWIQVSKRRLDGASLSQEVQDVFDELLEAGFEWCVRDYSKRLAGAIHFYQRGRPVVQYTHRNDKGSWKMEFFGPDIDPTLLREASPLTRAGIQHWFIHKSLLDYFLSLAVFDPDDCNKGGPDGDDDDGSGGDGGSDSHGGEGSLFRGGGDGMVDDGGKCGGVNNSSGGGGNLSGGGENSSGGGSNPSDGDESSAGVGGNTSGEGESSSGGNDNSSGETGGSSSGNHDSIGERGYSGAGNDGSNGDGDDSQRRKDNARSKRKARLDKSHTFTSSDIISKLNLFREPAVMQFLEERARSDVRFKMILSTTIEQSKSSVGPSLAAANAITILFKSGERFKDVDLDGVRVPSDYMVDETSDLVPLAGSFLDGVDLLNALLAPTVPDNTRKATSTFTMAISSSKNPASAFSSTQEQPKKEYSGVQTRVLDMADPLKNNFHPSGEITSSGLHTLVDLKTATKDGSNPTSKNHHYIYNALAAIHVGFVKDELVMDDTKEDLIIPGNFQSTSDDALRTQAEETTLCLTNREVLVQPPNCASTGSSGSGLGVIRLLSVDKDLPSLPHPGKLHQSTFRNNVTKPIFRTALPKSGYRFNSTPQLLFVHHFLSRKQSSTPPTSGSSTQPTVEEQD